MREKSNKEVLGLSLSRSLVDDDISDTSFNWLGALVEGFEMKRIMVVSLEMKGKGERNRGKCFWV